MPIFSIAARLLPPLLVAMLLALLQLRGGTDFSLVDAAAIAALAYVADASGRLLLHAARADELGPGAGFALGVAATCVAIYALGTTLGITAAWAFGIVALIAVGLELAQRPRRRVPSPDPRALAGFALCVALTAAWCWAPAGAYETLRTQGFLPVWSDYYFHGGLISQFGDPRALGHGSIYLAGQPSSFYHFASYGGAAALAGMQGKPGLPLATAAWLPLGFLAMLAGAQALGTRLAGAAGGVAALAALAMLPDASNYGLRNGWFSFHFTLVAHAGATYALGAAFVSLALLDRWAAERCRATLAASALLAFSVLFFRAHIFLLYLPAWIATAAFCAAPPSRRRRVGWLTIAGFGAGAATLGLLLHYLAEHGGAHWRLGGAALGRFLTVVHEWQDPTAYTGLYRDLVDYWPPYVALLAGVGLAVLAGLGALVVLLPAAATLAGRAGLARPTDSACAYLLYCWLLLMLFAPTPWHGEASDLTHRPFVLAYAAAAIWSACLLLRLARPGPAARLWQALFAAVILGLPWIFGNARPLLTPKFAWGEYDVTAHLPPGLVQAGEFLRANAATGDIFAVAGLKRGYATFDLGTQLCSLTGMPAYLTRPYLEMIKDAPRKGVVERRLAALEKIDALPGTREAMQALHALGVQWYVVAGGQGPPWDPQRRAATFHAKAVAVYAAKSAP